MTAVRTLKDGCADCAAEVRKAYGADARHRAILNRKPKNLRIVACKNCRDRAHEANADRGDDSTQIAGDITSILPALAQATPGIITAAAQAQNPTAFNPPPVVVAPPPPVATPPPMPPPQSSKTLELLLAAGVALIVIMAILKSGRHKERMEAAA
jgi:hypothetical protein